MSLRNHLDELVNKHRTLEGRIHDAESSPSTDDLRVVELKREKLRLKDQITRVEAEIEARH